MATSVEELIVYAAARGVVITDTTPTEQALVRATDVIVFGYVNRFSKGYNIDSDYVDEAIYEAAIIEVETPNFFTKIYTPADQKLLTEAKGVKWTPVVGGRNGRGGLLDATPTSTKIEAMLRPYLYNYIGLGSTG